MSLVDGFVSLLAPRRCLTCQASRWLRRPEVWSDLLCGPCWRRIELLEGGCPRCAAPGRSGRCGPCRRTPGEVATTVALLRYRRLGRQVLRQVKYRERVDVGLLLGRALGERWRATLPRRASEPGLIVVPVPLHPLRRWRRGFNQAETIAEGVAQTIERPLLVHALRRRRRTQPLYRVPRERRDAELSRSFEATRSLELAGRQVLLVDDIRTSGATLRAAAAALRSAGARRIDAAVVAR